MKGRKSIALITLLLMAGALSSCSRIDLFGKLKNGGGATVTPRNGQWVAASGLNAEIVIQFESSMDTAAPVMGGDLGAVSSAAWTTASELTITPAGWVPDVTALKSLTVTCSTTDGVSMTLDYSFLVAGSLRYVSASASGMTPDGSRSAPYTEIQTAIDEMGTTGVPYPGVVLVAAGTYTNAGTVVALQKNVSLYGGWATDWSEHNPANNISSLENTTSTPLTNPDVNKTMEITSDLGSNDVVVEGFTVTITPSNSNATYSALFIDKSPVTLRNMIINTGDASDVSYSNIRGIQIQGGCTALIEDSSIAMGQNTGTTDEHVNQGIFIETSSPEISNTNIHAGHSDDPSAIGGTWGIYINSSSPYIHNNTINGGTCNGYSYGVYISGTSAASYDCIIANNDIYGGAGKTRARGIHSASSASPIIYSNQITADSANDAIGIHVASSSVPAVIKNYIHAKGDSVARGFWITNDDTDSITYTEILNNVIAAESNSSYSYGIEVWSKDTRINIRNNTIYGGNGPSGAYAIHLENTTDPIEPANFLGIAIQNNNLFTESTAADRFGIYESNEASEPDKFSANNVFNCNIYYHRGDSTEINSTDFITSYPDNLKDEIYTYLDFSDEFRFNGTIYQTNPAITFDTAGVNGITEGWFLPQPTPNHFTVDWSGRNDVSPSDPWSIGSYEYD